MNKRRRYKAKARRAARKRDSELHASWVHAIVRSLAQQTLTFKGIPLVFDGAPFSNRVQFIRR